MTDVLGDALQRLSVTKSSAVTMTCGNPATTPAALPESSANQADSSSLPDSHSESALLAGPAHQPTVSALESVEAKIPKQLSATRGFDLAAKSDLAVRFVRDHRRQTAAAVVLLCMTWIWSDWNSGADSATGIVEDPGMPDVESMLSEFDAVAAQPLREPAEPMDSPGYTNAQLTIPQEGIDTSGSGTEFLQDAASSAAVAVYPDESNESSPPAATQRTSIGPGRVRFTGRIQPLK